MKLRSGKVLPSRYELPRELDNMLETKLENFKMLFSTNSQHARELLDIISMSRSIQIRFAIRDKIGEIYDIKNTLEVTPLMVAAGDLAWLLVYNPQYHDLIVNKIENFDLEMSPPGNTETNNTELE